MRTPRQKKIRRHHRGEFVDEDLGRNIARFPDGGHQHDVRIRCAGDNSPGRNDIKECRSGNGDA
ncbi:hypothetical protein ABH19_00775 [Leptospirillum sp. Group II 'CF-1']|nr:hypothetical protein ABH19_00775 [Leptospirillum sp. Group II 'CF-1']